MPSHRNARPPNPARHSSRAGPSDAERILEDYLVSLPPGVAGQEILVPVCAHFSHLRPADLVRICERASQRRRVQVQPPAPPLVGVEPNPGPRRSKRGKPRSTTIVEVKNSGGGDRARLPGKTMKPMRVVGNRPTLTPSTGQTAVIRDYGLTLMDPFNYGPIRLGYDCMVPTALATAYLRGSLTVNVDGSFGIIQLPSLVSSVYINVSGGSSTGANWTGVAYGNASPTAASMRTARVISGGIRIFVALAATAAPGILASGNIPENTQAGASAFSILSFSNSQTAEVTYDSRMVGATMRPIDNESYQFVNENIYGFGSGTIQHMSIPYIVGYGWPANTVIYYEAVLNLEGPQNIASGDPALPEPSLSNQASASDFFPTPQMLFNRVKEAVRDPVLRESAMDALASFAPKTVSGLRAANRLLTRGFHTRQVQRGPGRMIQIEEVKEDVGRDEL